MGASGERSRRIIVSLAALGGVLSAQPTAAQSGPARDTNPRIGCFRGQPLPACRSFWIVELQGVLNLVSSSRQILLGPDRQFPTREFSEHSFQEQLEWNLGHMFNVADRVAVGPVVTVGSGSDDPLTGIRARGRWWITSDISGELEGGMLKSNVVYPASVGLTAGIRLNIRDQGAFLLRYDYLELPEQSYGEYFDAGGGQHGLSLGLSLGSKPALVGTGALGLAYLVLLGILFSSGYD